MSRYTILCAVALITYLFRSSEVFKKWLQLGKQRNREKWEMFPSTVNAYFNPPANEVSRGHVRCVAVRLA